MPNPGPHSLAQYPLVDTLVVGPLCKLIPHLNAGGLVKPVAQLQGAIEIGIHAVLLVVAIIHGIEDYLALHPAESVLQISRRWQPFSGIHHYDGYFTAGTRCNMPLACVSLFREYVPASSGLSKVEVRMAEHLVPC